MSLGGFFGIVYEHLLICFILEDPSLRFLELFQDVVTVARGDIFRSLALVFGANRLLAMAKDLGGFHPIIVSDVFFQLISYFSVL